MKTLSRSAKFAAALKTWLPILLAAISILASIWTAQRQNFLQERQSELGQVFQPLNFSVSRGASTSVYQITDLETNEIIELPAYAVEIQIETGAYREFAQVRYSGTGKVALAYADLSVLKSGNYAITSTGQIPTTDYPANTATAYDYFFILTNSASGDRELWLIYYMLDLEQGSVAGPYKASQTLLLEQKAQIDPARAAMIDSFQALSDWVAAFPL